MGHLTFSTMPDDAPLDQAAIGTLRALNPDDGGEFFKELVGLFLQDTPPRIAEIEANLAAGDLQRLTRAAHSIKGSAGNFGASQLVAVSARIEQLGKAGDLTTVPPLLESLKAEFARAKAALEALADNP